MVLMIPGARQLTLMAGANSLASTLVSLKELSCLLNRVLVPGGGGGREGGGRAGGEGGREGGGREVGGEREGGEGGREGGRTKEGMRESIERGR